MIAFSSPHIYRAHSYVGAAVAGMFHTNAFVESNVQFEAWQAGSAVATYATEITELLPSFASRERYYYGMAWHKSHESLYNLTMHLHSSENNATNCISKFTMAHALTAVKV